MKTYTYTFTVPASAIDFNGHVNNVTYLTWMMEAASRHSQSVGMGFEQCLEYGGTWVAKSHHIEYKSPAFEGDELRMTTWIDTLGKIVSERRYELRKVADDFLICEGKTEWVFVDKKRMRPMRIPAQIAEAFPL
jgi:acyl-CoA thioester hydrolase